MTALGKMKVRVVYYGSIYDRNGAAKVVRTFADQRQLFFACCGHDVMVFDKSCPEVVCKRENEVKRGSYLLKPIMRRIKAILGKSIMEKYRNSYLGTKRLLERSLWVEKGRNTIDRYFSQSFDDDAIIFHDIFTCWAYFDYCKRNKLEPKKVILVLHTNGEMFKMVLINFPNINGTRYHKVMNKRAEVCYRYAKRIVFVSEGSARVFKQHYPVYAEKVNVVYNGIEDMSISPVFDGTVRMVTVGTVCRRKNQILQIDCLKRIRKHCDATLTVIGGGPSLEECKQRAEELNVSQWVSFLGSMDGVANEMAKCNLFVMSSLDEGLPISAIEALRAKLPVVLTDVGGCGELVKDNGYLVQPSINGIAEAVVDFCGDVEKQKKMSESSYTLYKEKFTVDAMIKGYSQIITEVLS